MRLQKKVIETAGLIIDHNGPFIGPQEKEEMISIVEPVTPDDRSTWS